ncbi:hypothetical protein IE81DRAFT_363287 [Ceraceosorus guamensis]|uniref:Uncharacterized protein n=1 Tax=Ceraceosorus guamensis TaxID=1522189 RepID=A0A316W8T2_9BASI|nr:hypothetical protein IE81DRAFT_363287 [Ceraceosorus guamensis]PWN46289.1 hypothetical protein IE81DRAFT_363287 [Ceraceosorus guamensis]
MKLAQTSSAAFIWLALAQGREARPSFSQGSQQSDDASALLQWRGLTTPWTDQAVFARGVTDSSLPVGTSNGRVSELTRHFSDLDKPSTIAQHEVSTKHIVPATQEALQKSPSFHEPTLPKTSEIIPALPETLDKSPSLIEPDKTLAKAPSFSKHSGMHIRDHAAVQGPNSLTAEKPKSSVLSKFKKFGKWGLGVGATAGLLTGAGLLVHHQNDDIKKVQQSQDEMWRKYHLYQYETGTKPKLKPGLGDYVKGGQGW